jgi:hypothetical protein
MRPVPASLIVLGLLAAACASAVKNKTTDPGGTGGAEPEDTGGAGGSATGGRGSGGSNTSGVGGTGGSTGGSGTGGSTATGGNADQPDAAVDAAQSSAADASTGDLGGTLATHPWVIPCQADWTRAQCCMHYCTCMMTNCASTLPANCVATCSAPGNNWNLKCRVEQCFEALDPKYPMDKASHCGHAVEKPPKCQGIIP